MEYMWHLTDLSHCVVPEMTTSLQHQQQQADDTCPMMHCSSGGNGNSSDDTITAVQHLNNNNNNNNKRKRIPEEDDEWRPPKRVSPFLNTPKQRKDEKRKLLRTSINKLKDIENAEVCLHRAVLLHNTIRKLQKQLREEKYTPRSPNLPGGRSYLSANAHLFVDHFVYADMDQIVDNSDLLDKMIGTLQTENDPKMAESDALKAEDLSIKSGDVMVDENCNHNDFVSSAVVSNAASADSYSACDNHVSTMFPTYPVVSTPPPAHSSYLDSAALDMRIKQSKVPELNKTQSVASDLSCNSNTLSGSIARAMNCVEGVHGGHAEDFIRTSVTTSTTTSSSSSPSSQLSGHTGYFSVIAPDVPYSGSSMPSSPAGSSSPVHTLHHHPHPHHSCSEAYQRERTASTSSSCLSPFLSLLDEPWGMIGDRTTANAADSDKATELDNVLGNLIGVMASSC